MNNTDLQVRYHKETEQQVLQTGKQMNLYYTDEYVRWLEAKVLQQVSGVNSENGKALPINIVSKRSELLKAEDPDCSFEQYLQKYYKPAEVEVTYKDKRKSETITEKALILQYKRAFRLL